MLGCRRRMPGLILDPRMVRGIETGDRDAGAGFGELDHRRIEVEFGGQTLARS